MIWVHQELLHAACCVPASFRLCMPLCSQTTSVTLTRVIQKIPCFSPRPPNGPIFPTAPNIFSIFPAALFIHIVSIYIYICDDISRVQVNSGRWTVAEHQGFLRGLEEYGSGNWAAISVFVPTRSSLQIEEHARQHFAGDDSVQQEEVCTCIRALVLPTVFSLMWLGSAYYILYVQVIYFGVAAAGDYFAERFPEKRRPVWGK